MALPESSTVITLSAPAGCMTDPDPWTTTLTSVTGTKTLTFSTAGRWILIINSTPGEPAAVRHKAIEQYVDVT